MIDNSALAARTAPLRMNTRVEAKSSGPLTGCQSLLTHTLGQFLGFLRIFQGIALGFW
jgi:hypothetical protein